MKTERYLLRVYLVAAIYFSSSASYCGSTDVCGCACFYLAFLSYKSPARFIDTFLSDSWHTPRNIVALRWFAIIGLALIMYGGMFQLTVLIPDKWGSYDSDLGRSSLKHFLAICLALPLVGLAVGYVSEFAEAKLARRSYLESLSALRRAMRGSVDELQETIRLLKEEVESKKFSHLPEEKFDRYNKTNVLELLEDLEKFARANRSSKDGS